MPRLSCLAHGGALLLLCAGTGLSRRDGPSPTGRWDWVRDIRSNLEASHAKWQDSLVEVFGEESQWYKDSEARLAEMRRSREPRPTDRAAARTAAGKSTLLSADAGAALLAGNDCRDDSKPCCVSASAEKLPEIKCPVAGDVIDTIQTAAYGNVVEGACGADFAATGPVEEADGGVQGGTENVYAIDELTVACRQRHPQDRAGARAWWEAPLASPWRWWVDSNPAYGAALGAPGRGWWTGTDWNYPFPDPLFRRPGTFTACDTAAGKVRTVPPNASTYREDLARTDFKERVGRVSGRGWAVVKYTCIPSNRYQRCGPRSLEVKNVTVVMGADGADAAEWQFVDPPPADFPGATDSCTESSTARGRPVRIEYAATSGGVKDGPCGDKRDCATHPDEAGVQQSNAGQRDFGSCADYVGREEYCGAFDGTSTFMYRDLAHSPGGTANPAAAPPPDVAVPAAWSGAWRWNDGAFANASAVAPAYPSAFSQFRPLWSLELSLPGYNTSGDADPPKPTPEYNFNGVAGAGAGKRGTAPAAPKQQATFLDYQGSVAAYNGSYKLMSAGVDDGKTGGREDDVLRVLGANDTVWKTGHAVWNAQTSAFGMVSSSEDLQARSMCCSCRGDGGNGTFATNASSLFNGTSVSTTKAAAAVEYKLDMCLCPEDRLENSAHECVMGRSIKCTAVVVEPWECERMDEVVSDAVKAASAKAVAARYNSTEQLETRNGQLVLGDNQGDRRCTVFDSITAAEVTVRLRLACSFSAPGQNRSVLLAHNRSIVQEWLEAQPSAGTRRDNLTLSPEAVGAAWGMLDPINFNRMSDRSRRQITALTGDQIMGDATVDFVVPLADIRASDSGRGYMPAGRLYAEFSVQSSNALAFLIDRAQSPVTRVQLDFADYVQADREVVVDYVTPIVVTALVLGATYYVWITWFASSED